MQYEKYYLWVAAKHLQSGLFLSLYVKSNKNKAGKTVAFFDWTLSKSRSTFPVCCTIHGDTHMNQESKASSVKLCQTSLGQVRFWSKCSQQKKNLTLFPFVSAMLTLFCFWGFFSNFCFLGSITDILPWCFCSFPDNVSSLLPHPVLPIWRLNLEHSRRGSGVGAAHFLKCRPFKSHICFHLQSAPAGGKVERLNGRKGRKDTATAGFPSLWQTEGEVSSGIKSCMKKNWLWGKEIGFFKWEKCGGEWVGVLVFCCFFVNSSV